MLWWCKQRSGNFGQNFECSRQWGITRFSFWWISHSGGLLQEVSWKWLHKDSCRLSNFWCAASKTVLSKSSISGFWDIRPFFNDRVHCYSIEGAEHRDWMQSRQSLRMDIKSSNLSLPGLLDVVSNIIGVWTLILSYLKETGKKDNGDSLVVWFFLLVSFS